MKIGVLTSSRADFGIYLPLLKELKSDHSFDLQIIAFGTHLSKKFGNTIYEIEGEGFQVAHRLKTLPKDDSPVSIAEAIGKTTETFSSFWSNNQFDLIFAFGDRYEMFGAVLAASPFNLRIAHIHAGETTLGAIDNAYRHSISLMSKYLFVTTEEYKNRAIEIINRPEDVFNVGALSIDNLVQEHFYTIKEFKKLFDIDLQAPSILTTFHPETVNFKKNLAYIRELISALEELSSKYQIIITMPNSDTDGLKLRHELEAFGKRNKDIEIVESFGMKGYLSCMKHCSFLLGNTSSGFVEAAYFPKMVLNLGNRQDGRILTENIRTISVSKESILLEVKHIESMLPDKSCNIYGDGTTAVKLKQKIKELYGIN
jgi:GDP/UDP-N,N'-diacetylbacillosamine 2-epimerase (hydrolysing)